MIEDVISRAKEQLSHYINSDSEYERDLAGIYVSGFISGLDFDSRLLLETKELHEFWTAHLELNKAVCRIRYPNWDMTTE